MSMSRVNVVRSQSAGLPSVFTRQPNISESPCPDRKFLGNGRIAEQRDIEEALLDLSTNPIDDMFASREDRLASAYRPRAHTVAYREPRRESIDLGTNKRVIMHADVTTIGFTKSNAKRFFDRLVSSGVKTLLRCPAA